MARDPVLAGTRVELARRRHVERADELRRALRIGVDRLAVAVELESVAAPEHPEVIVEGVVLHHEDHDVLDLRIVSTPSAGSGSGATRACARLRALRSWCWSTRLSRARRFAGRARRRATGRELADGGGGARAPRSPSAASGG
jgi:hypothetical protein